MTATITPLPDAIHTNEANLTLVKRNDKAAIYRRESPEGKFLSFDVFAIKSQNGFEIYPDAVAAVAGWCWSPASEERANTWFDRITNGDIVIPNVDPITGEPIGVDNRSLDELPDVTEISLVGPTVETTTVETPVAVEVAPEPVVSVEPEIEVEIPEVDPTEPTVAEPPVAEVAPTEGGTTPVKGRGRKPADLSKLVIPAGEFTQAEFANANGLPERGVVWSRLDGLVSAGTLTKRFVSNGKGRPKAVFTKTVSDS